MIKILVECRVQNGETPGRVNQGFSTKFYLKISKNSRFGFPPVFQLPLVQKTAIASSKVIPLVIFVLSLKQVTYFSRFYVD